MTAFCNKFKVNPRLGFRLTSMFAKDIESLAKLVEKKQNVEARNSRIRDVISNMI